MIDSLPRRLGLWLRAAVARQRVEREMAAEMRHHLELEIEERVRAGESAEEARRLALVAFGGLELAKEAVRDERGTRCLDSAAFELRTAFVRLRRRPGFALGSALSLAIGMALATAVFSIVDSVFLRPLPFPAQAQLVHVYEIKGATRYPYINARHFVAIHDGARSLARVAAIRYFTPDVAIGRSGVARRFDAAAVTPDLFDALGVHPVLGRGFTAADDIGPSRPVVISYAVWQARFGGDPNVIIRPATIDGRARMIVGVMPRGFAFPAADVLLPLSLDSIRAQVGTDADDRGFARYGAVGRLAPGADPANVTSELQGVYAQANRAAPRSDESWRPRAISLAEHVTAPYRETLTLWAAAAVVVALLCAVNFAAMLLARGMRRRGEIALRSAIGASRARVALWLTVDGVLIALVGGAVAVVVAAWMIGASRAWFGDALPNVPVIGWRALAFGLVGTCVVGACCALAPAVDLSCANLRALIGGDTSSLTVGGRELRGRRLLVALQAALALSSVAVLATLVGADRRWEAAGPGYDYSRMLTADIAAPDSAGRGAELAPLATYLASLRGVRGATIVRSPSGFNAPAAFLNDLGATLEAHVMWADVTPEYFAMLHLRPVAGRLPTSEEVRAHAPVAVLSESSARWLFGSRIAVVGHRVRARTEQSSRRSGVWLTVVGVVPDVRFGPRFDWFGVPVYTEGAIGAPAREARMFADVSGSPSGTVHRLGDAIARFDDRLLVTNLEPVASQVDRWRAPSRLRTTFMAAVALVALALAAIGVYGLTSFTVEARMRELALRVALGASPSHVIRLLSRELAWFVVVGLPIGWFASERTITLLDVHAGDPLRLRPALALATVPAILAGTVLLAVALLAMAMPLRRALRLDVMRNVQGG